MGPSGFRRRLDEALFGDIAGTFRPKAEPKALCEMGGFGRTELDESNLSTKLCGRMLTELRAEFFEKGDYLSEGMAAFKGHFWKSFALDCVRLQSPQHLPQGEVTHESGIGLLVRSSWIPEYWNAAPNGYSIIASS
jgi:hypothetical protein